MNCQIRPVLTWSEPVTLLVTNLDPEKRISAPHLRYQPINVLPEENLCANVEASCVCYNPGQDPNLLETGFYCEHPTPIHSYYAYIFTNLSTRLDIEVQISVPIDNSTHLNLSFLCVTGSFDCTLLQPDSIPLVGIFPMATLEMRWQPNTDWMQNILLSPSELFPFTPFPEGAFSSARLPPQMSWIPSCNKPEEPSDFFESTIPHPDRVYWSDYGINLTSATLLFSPTSSLSMSFEYLDPLNFVYLELQIRMPNKWCGRRVLDKTSMYFGPIRLMASEKSVNRDWNPNS